MRIGQRADRTNSARVARKEVQMQLMRPSKLLARPRPGRGLWIRLTAGIVALATAGMLASGAIAGDGAHRNVFKRVNLISDIDGVARITDPNLVNPWGMAASPSSPLWVNDNGTNVSTLYSGGVHGSIPQILSLVVSIPSGEGTGIVFNPGSDFKIGGTPAKFIFDSEAEVLSAWTSGTAAQQEQMIPDAVYKGLAIGTNSHGMSRLYASNFHAGTVDVFDASFQPVTLPAGAFTDPSLPAGYAQFGIQELDGKLYVTYALQDPDKHDDVAGAGHGFVDVYDNDGHLLKRLISMGALDSPWGLVIAPRDFGPFGGDLLVGNFGEDPTAGPGAGSINAYDRRTGAFEGTLMNRDGNPIRINGLWGLRFGNGTFGAPDTLVFTAGIGDEGHGLLGEIKARG
jgi:uncharacterized protein (TIGR03118 family)